MHFFSAEGWQSWGLDGEPLIPERMPVLFDDDFLFEDEGGPRATRAVKSCLQRLRRELSTLSCTSLAPVPKQQEDASTGVLRMHRT
ncbi:hypothetical protein [Streptomyces sp. NBC_00868]|uniref:hypothetical protein n=1 Tax=Streptomyces sp. NBC_00868 TaxID=2903683 RepID=UPI003867123E